MITGHTRLYGLIGHPVRHSLSPAIHNAWFAHHGIDAVYLCLDAPSPPADLADALRGLGLAGVNLTVPHKRRLMRALDDIGPAAAAIGAVNTVVVREGRLIGANTDGDGFLHALDAMGIAPGRAVVLGAGGAGRAVVWALRQRGVAVTLLNRSVERARPIAHALGADVGPLSPAGFRAAVPTDLVVQALPGSARASVAALPATCLPPAAGWIDLNYWDPSPPHLDALARAGHPVQSGLPMLLHQAALAFGHFTGRTPDLDVARPIVAALAGAQRP